MIYRWHSWLSMPKFDKVWHENDIADELAEYHQETKLIKKWSELSDVVYTCTRARWSGHNLSFPLNKRQFFVGLPYMYLKYRGRYLFFKPAGQKAGANKAIRCVRNPHKLHKLEAILVEQNITVDKELLKNLCTKQLRYWPLLP